MGLNQKMTLGEAYHFFDVLQAPMKNKVIDTCIAEYRREYSATLPPQRLPTTMTLSNIFRFINHFRNICAHEERLFNTVLKDRNGHIPQINHFHKQGVSYFKSRVFDCVLILGFFLTKKDYRKFIRQLSDEIGTLQEHLPPSSFNAVLILMGFPTNWIQRIQLP